MNNTIQENGGTVGSNHCLRHLQLVIRKRHVISDFIQYNLRSRYIVVQTVSNRSYSYS